MRAISTRLESPRPPKSNTGATNCLPHRYRPNVRNKRHRLQQLTMEIVSQTCLDSRLLSHMYIPKYQQSSGHIRTQQLIQSLCDIILKLLIDKNENKCTCMSY